MSKIENRSGATSSVVINVTGVVQGVGFRPFVHRLATGLGLAGGVINTGGGVEIKVDGAPEDIEALLKALKLEAPPLARIADIDVSPAISTGSTVFEIGRSVDKGGRQIVSPDSCTCDNCLTELFDSSNRRYRYPFINCTNCGPRFTIIEGLPYDRPLTTMKEFEMCPECRAEYEEPGNRRFHAEPNACPVCGPRLWLADPDGRTLPETDPLAAAASALREGKIVAIKSLGGFQLACLAIDETAVSLLRQRKRRPHKPFAIMVEAPENAALICRMSAEEHKLLASVERPIVLMEQLEDGEIAAGVASGLRHLGVILPYTPLHFLLMNEIQAPLIMTSGNLSEESICRTNSEAIGRLHDIADLFLLHDRRIVSTYDDSVGFVLDREPMLVRRARGYAPLPLKLPKASDSMLAVGGELKNTFCLTRGGEAFVSQHIGDLKDVESILHYERTEKLYERLFRSRPNRTVCDGHPDYLSTAYANERDPEPIRVQHHQAHIASCLAENSQTGLTIGVALDGTGFGDDGAIWGGEFFIGSLDRGFERVAHLEYMPLLGGEAAINEPWRMALAAAWEYSPEDIEFVAELLRVPQRKLELLLRQLEAGLNCSRTSSCGRLFDAVAALTIKRLSVSYEAQAAIEFEAVAGNKPSVPLFGPDGLVDRRRSETPETSAGSVSYRFSLDRSIDPWIISPGPVIIRIIRNLAEQERPEIISRRFHLGLAEVIVRTCLGLSDLHGLNSVSLSGGVFQNRLLLQLVRSRLDREGLETHVHHLVPSNDGGISLGQAAIACYRSGKIDSMEAS